MPLNRTPPPPNNSPVYFKSPLEYYSDSNTSEMTEQDTRSSLLMPATSKAKKDRLPKRKRGDIDDVSKAEVMEMFIKLREEQSSKFSMLMQSYNDIKAAMDFISSKYEDMICKVQGVEKENKSLHKRIQALEIQNEIMSRSARSTSVEIRNIPQMPTESKANLKSIIKTSADTLQMPLEALEIRDVYRTNSRSTIKPIIVDFTTVGTRDKFLSAYKKYNKEHISDKLGTATLKIQGTNRPVYISENLTHNDRRLFYLARSFIKAHNYTYCWVSYGKIYIKKSEGDPPIRIANEETLEHLQKK